MPTAASSAVAGSGTPGGFFPSGPVGVLSGGGGRYGGHSVSSGGSWVWVLGGTRVRSRGSPSPGQPLKKKAPAPFAATSPTITTAAQRTDQGTRNRIRLVMTVTPTRVSAGDRLGEVRRPGKRRGHIADGARRVKRGSERIPTSDAGEG